MPHFHLSVQSGDDMILKRMKRRHARRDTIAFCETVRRHRGPMRPSAPISSPAFRPKPMRCFENSLNLVDDAGLTFLHVFPVQRAQGHAGVRACRSSNGAVIKERAARLRARGERRWRRAIAALVGTHDRRC